MAMNGKTLGDTIADLIISSDAPAEQKKQVKELWEKIGGAIVDHIKGATIKVNSGIPVSTNTGTGSTTGPGTGSIS